MFDIQFQSSTSTLVSLIERNAIFLSSKLVIAREMVCFDICYPILYCSMFSVPVVYAFPY